MQIQDIFHQLSYNELSNLTLGEDGAGDIKAEDQAKVVLYLNQGLRRLYSRFVLKELDVLVMMYDHITNYHLHPRFAVNYTPTATDGSDDEPIRYLLDLPHELFKGDVLKILTAHDSKGHKLPLNDDEAVFSIFTPQANILQVPNPVHGQSLSVLYQANHVKLQGDLEEQIVIPDILEEALTAFVAYKVYSHMNTQEMTAKAQEHLTVYESVCSEATDKDLVNSSRSTTSSKFANRGWV